MTGKMVSVRYVSGLDSGLFRAAMTYDLSLIHISEPTRLC